MHAEQLSYKGLIFIPTIIYFSVIVCIIAMNKTIKTSSYMSNSVAEQTCFLINLFESIKVKTSLSLPLAFYVQQAPHY